HHPFPHGQISASFGIASLPEDVGAAAEDLIRAADEALYIAKRAGKNRVSLHQPALPTLAEEPVLMPAIAGGSDAPLHDTRPTLAATDRLPSPRFREPGVLVLHQGANVREAPPGP